MTENCKESIFGNCITCITGYYYNKKIDKCIEKTDNLIFLLKLYAEIVWKGLNFFGFTTPGVKYFEDWYNLQQELTSLLNNNGDYCHCGVY